MFINRCLFRFSQGCRRKLTKLCLVELFFVTMSTLISLCAALIVQMLLRKEHVLCFSSVWQIAPVLFVLVGGRIIVTRKKSVMAEECGVLVKDNLRIKMLNKLFELGPAYTGSKRTGEIATMFFSKIEWLKNYYSTYVPVAISSFINSLILTVVIALLDIPTALICFAACVGLFFCPMSFFRVMKVRGDAEWKAGAKYYSECLDSIQGMTKIKSFNADEKQRLKIYMVGEELRQKVMSQLRITMIENAVLEFLIRLGSALSIVVAVSGFLRGRMSPESLVYTMFLVLACFAPMLMLNNAWHLGYKGVAGSESIETYLNEPVRQQLYCAQAPKTDEFSSMTDLGVTFKNVSFAYNKDEGNVLKDVSFHLPGRSVMALVGASGSGKSTVAHLLAGFYPSDNGSISLGGVEVTGQNVSQAQELIATIWQDSHIFYGTVYDNILIGNPSADREDVIFAAKCANIHELIDSLPDGYDTLLGEDGMRFSGGERQRIALARVFLRNSPIVIFDEATSSLDRKNEMAIQESFRTLQDEKTVLVIAHRLDTIRYADHICIMNAGRIEALGTHEELLGSSAAYRSLIGIQLQ